jgi:hypothetical protein
MKSNILLATLAYMVSLIVYNNNAPSPMNIE